MRKVAAGLLGAGLLLGVGQAATWAGEIRGQISIRSALQPRAQGRQQHAGGTGYGYGAAEEGEDAAETFTAAQERTHAVVYVLGTGLRSTPREHLLRQRGRQFLPHVLPVVRGSSVRFTNEDPFLHSIYSETAGSQFLLPKYGRGARGSRAFTAPGPVEIFCGIHSRMNAYLYVVDNDFYAQPAPDGAYVIHDLPAGTWTVRVWHPRLRAREGSVQVPASGAATLNLTL